MKIIIIDDDPLITSSLKTIIEAGGIEVAACGTSGAEAIFLYDQHKPDIVLMDIRMDHMNGLKAAKYILEEDPEAKILLLTTFKDKAYISEALALGCRGYLLKQNFGSILPSLKAIAAGSYVFDSEVIDKLSEVSVPEPDERLNAREQRMVGLIAEGLNNKEIAERLNLSEGTVRNYLSEILDTLNLRDRTQLAVYYYKRILDKN